MLARLASELLIERDRFCLLANQDLKTHKNRDREDQQEEEGMHNIFFG